MRSLIRRVLTVCLSLTMCAGVFTVISSAVTDQSKPDAVYPEVFQQFDTRWSERELIGPNGCGLLSLVNAVNYLTGNFIDPVELAVYAHKIDAYNGSVGGGTARWVLYHQLEKYEKKYGFKVVQTGKDAGVTHKDFIAHLKSGGAAVCHVSGHFIAIVGYNAKDKTYLVYDSAANPDRRHTTASPTWLSASWLTTSDYMTVDWWCLLSATEESENTVAGRTYTNQAVTTSVLAGYGSEVTLEGTVMTSRPITGLGYVIDYDYDHPYTVPGDFKADADTRKSFSVTADVSGLDMGMHTLRLYAMVGTNGYSDIAEYSIIVHDGSDYVDEATGNLILGISGFLGQTNVIKKLSVTGYDCPMFRADGGDVLYLGYLDLSLYKSCVVEYATRANFDVDKKGVTGLVGLKSAKVSYGYEETGYDMTGSLATVDLTEPAEGEGGFSHFREAVIDLESVDRIGNIYLSLYNPSSDFIVVKSVKFLTGVEPATEPPTEAPTEPASEADTSAADAESGTEAATDAPDEGGCFGCVSAAALPVLLGAAYVTGRRKKK